MKKLIVLFLLFLINIASADTFTISGNVYGLDLSRKYIVQGYDMMSNGQLLSETQTDSTGNFILTIDIGKIVYRLEFRNQAKDTLFNYIISYLGWSTNTILTNIPLPVKIESYSYSILLNRFTLNWKVSQELNCKGYEIYRNSKYLKFIKSGLTNYSYTDKDLAVGKYSYYLKQIDYNGNSQIFNLWNDINIANPNSTRIVNIYPNPTNSITRIDFNLSEQSNVRIELYDISGRLLKRITYYKLISGYYDTYIGYLENFSSGIYFIMLKTDNFQEIKRLIIIK
jgi:hypothetical protein